LNSASDEGHTDIVQLLLERGADASVPSNDGWTPLHCASSKGHIDIVKLLLGHPGINARETDALGRTALFLASRFGQDQVVQTFLLDNCIDTQATDIYGSTCLFPAVANGHLDVVKLLMATGMAIEKQNSFGRDMAWWALNAGNPQISDLIAQSSGQSGGQAGDTAIRDNISTSIFDYGSAWCDACTLSTQDGCEYYCDDCGSIYLCSDCFDRNIRCRDASHSLILGWAEVCPGWPLDTH
jgi:hypothetical protein